MSFINPHLQSLCHRRAFIATQLPLLHTVVDLWRLVYEYNCSCVITLEQPEHNDMVKFVTMVTYKSETAIYSYNTTLYRYNWSLLAVSLICPASYVPEQNRSRFVKYLFGPNYFCTKPPSH